MSHVDPATSCRFVRLLGALACALLATTSALAYDQYSTNGSTGNCASCHGDFRSTSTSEVDGQSYGQNLHNLHRNSMLSGDCSTCHSDGAVFTFVGSSAGGDGLPGFGCSGCHGRAEDGSGTGTVGFSAGLRQHHWNAGITNCVNCHADSDPAAMTPAAESVPPPYYANPGNGHPNMPTDACNPAPGLPENFGGGDFGIDNDGDGLWDGDDPDCAAAQCGNGVLETGEDCDDGNTAAGDCCAADCAYETAGSPCDDGAFCNIGETCDGFGNCMGGAANTCDDADICTDDTCDEGAAECVNVFDQSNDMSCLLPCPDADQDGFADCPTIAATAMAAPPFELDRRGRTRGMTKVGRSSRSNELAAGIPDCDPTGLTCGDCDDADPGTNPAAVENCTNGIDDDCDGTIDDLDDDCIAGGVCGNGLLEEGEECDDGNTTNGDCCSIDCTWDLQGSACDDGFFCTVDDACDGAGGCLGGGPRDCDDGDICTDDSCDDSLGACVNAPDSSNDPSCVEAVCGNGTLEGDEQCDDGNLEDGDCCRADCVWETAGSACDDGVFCTVGEICDGSGSCDAGLPRDCDDGDVCTDDACDETAGSCENVPDATNDPSCEEPINVHLRAVTDCSNCHLTGEGETDLRPLHDFACSACHTTGFASTLLGPIGTWDYECSACHNPDIAETGNLDEPTKGHRCVVCHGTQILVSDVPDMHEEHIETANCVVCHGVIPSVEADGVSGARQVCRTCHGGSHRSRSVTTIHRKHVPEGLSCLECHGGVRPPVDVYDGEPVGNATNVCQICHSSADPGDFDDKLHKKHVSERMDCGACHASANLQDDRVPMPPIDDVVRANARMGNICLLCHDDLDGADSQEIHEEHVADQWQWCFNCHASGDRRPLGTEGPVTQPSESCQLCHDGRSFDDDTPFDIHEEHADLNKCYSCHQGLPPLTDWPASWLIDAGVVMDDDEGDDDEGGDDEGDEDETDGEDGDDES